MSTHEDSERRVVPRSEVLSNARRDPPPPATPSRPVMLLVAGVAAGIALAVVAGVAAGGGFAIAVLIFVAALLVFFGVHRALALSKTRRYGDRAADASAEDADDPIPHVGFDEETALGDSAQQPAIADEPRRSTGRR